jgi:hypothetical protein
MLTFLPRRTGRMFAVVLLACLAVSLFVVGYPMYVIRPFRAQGASELAVALVVARFRPLIAALSAGLALMALIWYWRLQAGKWQRAIAAVGTVSVLALAVAARLNVFEMMFHPVEHPSFSAASQVALDKDEKVIAIRIGGIARAYPIRGMSYHHIVNDAVERAAIVATY